MATLSPRQCFLVPAFSRRNQGRAPPTSPTNGTLTFHPDGTFTYTPNTHYVGSDSFTYTWSDGLTTGNTATVSIDVYNSAPVAYQAVVHTYRNQLVSGQLDGYDPDGDPIYAFLNSEPGVGSVYLGLDGTFSYIPPEGFVGAETFSYYWSDGISASEIASVTIEISNRAPVAVDMSIETVEDTPGDV
jgi:hypothetical protein